jgi:hypothetical protein
VGLVSLNCPFKSGGGEGRKEILLQKGIEKPDIHTVGQYVLNKSKSTVLGGISFQ